MEKAIRVILVDDEPLARRRLQNLLAEAPDVQVAAECPDGRSALQAIARCHPHLVFLDIQMPEMDGFEVVRQLPTSDQPRIIFVTAFDAYAVQAFEVQALDYLLKPIDDDRFHKALQRARQSLAGPSGREEAAPLTGLEAAPLRRLLVKDGGRIRVLRTEEIDYVSAEDYCIRFHTGPETWLVRDSLQHLLSRLDPAQFARIHRSFLVRLESVREVKPVGSGEAYVLLHGGTRLPLSAAYQQKLLKSLQG